MIKIFAILSLILLLVTTGCSGNPTATVRGVVSVAGRTPIGGRIVFEGEGRAYSGIVAADGSFTLQSGTDSPISPGEFKVLLIPPAVNIEIDRKNGEYRPAGSIDATLFPEKYRAPNTTDLTRRLVEGDNELKIEFLVK